MKTLHVLSFVLIFLLFTNCEKDKNTELFNGLVVTNENGETVFVKGTEDGDWKFDDEFPDNVSRLFDIIFSCPERSLQKAQLKSVNSDSIVYVKKNVGVICYPNPTPNYLHLDFSFPDSTKGNLKLVLADENLNVLLSRCYMINNEVIILRLELEYIEGINQDKLYRVYYLTEDYEGNVSNMGHGDIMRSDDYY